MDEFQRIGRMPIVAESISLLRSYGGNLALVTQTIPDLDVVYGDQVRKTLQGGAGIKLYLTPSESETIAEMSDAVGMTTKRVVSKSKNIKDGLFSNNISERTEEHPLLTKDEARRLPSGEVVIVVDGDMPIRAKGLVYYDDTAYQELYESQNFNEPLPAPPHTITEADYTYLETADDIADEKAEAEDANAHVKARAAQKRDKQKPEEGQRQFDFDASAQPVEEADGQRAFAIEGAGGPTEKPEAAGPTQEPKPDAKALAEGAALKSKAARYRRPGGVVKAQTSLPLPEGGKVDADASLDDAVAASLKISKAHEHALKTLKQAS